jgi:hypothetical protein
MRDTASVGLKRVGVHLLEFLARGLQGGVVNIICDAEIFNAFPSLATTPRAEVTMKSTASTLEGSASPWTREMLMCGGILMS